MFHPIWPVIRENHVGGCNVLVVVVVVVVVSNNK